MPGIATIAIIIAHYMRWPTSPHMQSDTRSVMVIAMPIIANTAAASGTDTAPMVSAIVTVVGTSPEVD